jgi:hypothetical protein
MKRYTFRMNAALIAATALWIGLPALSGQTVTTIAGGYLGDEQLATNAAFTFAPGVAQDQYGNYYVSDLIAQRIRKIDSRTGRISTFAGTGIQGYKGDGIPATTAQLNFPTHLRFDSVGKLVVSDSGNCRVRRIDTSGIVTTIAGNGTCGYSGDGRLATLASLGNGYGIGYDPIGYAKCKPARIQSQRWQEPGSAAIPVTEEKPHKRSCGSLRASQ